MQKVKHLSAVLPRRPGSQSAEVHEFMISPYQPSFAAEATHISLFSITEDVVECGWHQRVLEVLVQRRVGEDSLDEAEKKLD